MRERGEAPLAVFQNRAFALGGASPGRSGAHALADGAAPGAGARLPRAGDPGAGRGAERRAGVRRHGRSQGRARRGQLKRWCASWSTTRACSAEESDDARSARPPDRCARCVRRSPRRRRWWRGSAMPCRSTRSAISSRFAGGLDFARALAGAGKQVFLDLKLHDIGNTVAQGRRERREARRDVPHRARLSADHARRGRCARRLAAAHPRRHRAHLLRRRRPRRGGLRLHRAGAGRRARRAGARHRRRRPGLLGRGGGEPARRSSAPAWCW